MSSALNLHQLVDEPFGPYPEQIILSETFPRPRNSLIPLNDVWMSSNKKPTGLDHTEYAATPPSNLPPVQFFGILQIAKLEWLSEKGLQWIEEDLRERDQEENGVEESGLTLRRLYGDRPADGSRISVLIQCDKILNASFLTMAEHPESLVFRSVSRNSDTGKDIHRLYDILSLDVETYSKSRNYLERWRFYALVKELINNSNIPEEERTPAWIIEGMIKKHHDSSRFHRHVYVPGYDSGVDKEGYTTLPRRPRHIPKSAAYHILAMHAEWFLAQQLSTDRSDHHLVNLSAWYKFCLKAKKAKRAVRKGKGRWGKWGSEHRNKGEKSTENECIVDLERHGSVNGGWEDRIKRKCIMVKPKKTKAVVPMDEDEDVEEDKPEPVFDSDFSVESSPPVSDSEYDDDDEPLLHEIKGRIPHYTRHPPKLPYGRFEWECPDETCNFHIDLLNMQNSTALSNEDYLFMRSKQWSVYDERVQEIFFTVVSEHYEEHLSRRGLLVVREPTRRNKRKVSWFRRLSVLYSMIFGTVPA